MDNGARNGYILEISPALLEKIHQDGERKYPEEGAGLLLGSVMENRRTVKEIILAKNIQEPSTRRRRYAISPYDFAAAEDEAEKGGLELLGVFHSHPDHSDLPSEFDLELAVPWFSYLITSIVEGQAKSSRSWRLLDDRTDFSEEVLEITSEKGMD
jgi:proteasome lid subunit RPN8/RPN11